MATSSPNHGSLELSDTLIKEEEEEEKDEEEEEEEKDEE